MYRYLTASLLLGCCCLAWAAPQEEEKSAVRPTRQALPVGGYPGNYYPYSTPYPVYSTAYPTAYPGAYGGPIYRRPVRPPVYRPGPGPVAGGSEASAAIVSQVQDGPDFAGNFNFAYETENGISAQVSGQAINAGTEAEGQAMRGSFSYTSPEGLPITVNWYADDTGFHAEGEHLPRQPVVPTGPEVPYGYQGNGRPLPIRPILARPVPSLAP